MTICRCYEKRNDGIVYHSAYEKSPLNAADVMKYLRATAQVSFRRFVVFRFD